MPVTTVQHSNISANFSSKTKVSFWDYEEQHIRCLNHIINIAVQALLKKCKVLNNEVVAEMDLGEDEDIDEEELRRAQLAMREPGMR